MQVAHERSHPRRRIQQIHVQAGGSPQELQPFKRARATAAGHKFLRAPAERVYPVRVDGQPFPRDMHLGGVDGPVADQRFLDLADDAFLEVHEYATPRVRIAPNRILVPDGSGGFPAIAGGAREIVGKIVPDLLQRLGKMQFRPGQAPQIARRTVRALELQRLIDPFPRCRSHDPLLTRSDHMHAARRDPHGDGTGRTGRIQCAVAGIPRTRTVLITGNVRVHAVPEVDGVMLLKSLLHSALQTPGLTRVLPVRQWVPTGV